jgi:large subunit ribosomal protein L23
MALFKKKTDADKEKVAKKAGTESSAGKKEKKEEPKAALVAVGEVGGRDLSSILLRPHVTEKATDLADRGNVYAFEVRNDANKVQVALAVEKLYKVTPIKIAIVIRKPKYTVSRSTNRQVIKKHSLKKALVYLKKGEKIEFV